ncbi:holin [Leucobacter sp. OH1287]|uniref:holin n=1 Tax=Leucobacter sp. OH1287 TaxID=2491049 RepID=UPI000F5DAB4C|nr:holin [Leucobacter sp. OH1287]RRD61386.1 holin [Leucobacter sp. OH1287]
MFKKRFWKDAAERAVKTAAQVAAATLGANAAGLLDADWVGVASVSGLAAVLSLLTSVASAPLGDANTASVVPAPKHAG